MASRYFAFDRVPLAIAYFIAASVAVALTRYDGGIAFLWIATPLLIADLLSRPRRQWPASVLPCAIASGLATGLFGLGWAAALPFVGITCWKRCSGRGSSAATGIRSARSDRSPGWSISSSRSE
jgi:integral membrane sensor domain MASE1